MTEDAHELRGDGLFARVNAHGAELSSLRDDAGRDYIWPALPAWPRHAPILFPIVGRLKNDVLIHRGVSYPMTQHGFARDRRFEWVDRGAATCRLALRDNAQTRVHYPFAFCLELAYAIVGAAVEATFTIVNSGAETLPASIGAHPAFRWPLVAGVAKQAHALTFESDEPGKLRGVSGGLLTAADRPSPIKGRELALSPDLFSSDALILDHPASGWVRFTAKGAPAVTVSWDGFEQLGIWSRADADFLCIEPWRGMSSPEDFDGEFIDKPWLMLIPPGGQAETTMRIEISP